jgi:branched-subunit amino acid aminotransferase/4-amino-4-deoxychorismate lyase
VTAPLVVDSWLVADGAVRALDRHEWRFRRGCALLLPDLAEDAITEVFAGVRDRVPAGGNWFPRAEARSAVDARLVLRPAPKRGTHLRLWVAPPGDPRRHPTVKGPDLDALADLRTQAVQAGADDALLRTADGLVLEVAHSALIWWRGDVLCLPDPDLPVLPSVTTQLVRDLATEQGAATCYERVAVEQFLDAEVWAVNALHGIRSVSGIGGEHIDTERIARYRGLLDAVAAPIKPQEGAV